MAYPDNLEELKSDVKGTDAMTAHAELHNDANDIVNKLQNFVGTKTDDSTSGTVAGALNDLGARVDEIETNGGGGGGDSFPDVTDEDNNALMVRDGNVEWDTVTPDDVRYADNVIFVLPGDFDTAGKTQGEVNVALRDGLRDVDGALEELAVSLGLEITVDGDKNIIISPNPSPDPDNLPIADVSGKLDKGTGLNAKDAKELEDSITKNSSDIANLLLSLGLEIILDGEGNLIIVPIGGNEGDKVPSLEEIEETLDLKFDKGGVATLTDAGLMETEINAIANRLVALENTSISAEWKIASLTGDAPADGELSVNSSDWDTVTSLNFSQKDNNGTEHDFGSVNVGDTIQIGVGPSGRAAGSSAAYEVKTVAADGLFTVDHMASTGAPTVGFVAVVASYPAFDPSNYATKAEFDALVTETENKVNVISNGEDNAKVTGVMALTQEQYTNLSVKDPYTIYLISDYEDPLPDKIAGIEKDISTISGDVAGLESIVTENADAIELLQQGVGEKDILTTDVKLAYTAGGRATTYETQSDFNNAFAPFFVEGDLKWGSLAKGIEYIPVVGADE